MKKMTPKLITFLKTSDEERAGKAARGKGTYVQGHKGQKQKQCGHLEGSERKYSSPLNSTDGGVSVELEVKEGLFGLKKAERILHQ